MPESTVVDPTQNVRELVLAESKYQDAMRVSLERLIDEKTTFQNALRDAETRRIDQLATTRQEFQNTIRDMLAESVRTTSTLVSTQLVQIQATFDARVSKLEAFQFTQAGKSSVSDPATADALSRMAAGIASLSLSTTEAMGKTATATAEAIAKLTMTLTGMQSMESRGAGVRTGMKDLFGYFIVSASVLIAAATLYFHGH
jgi:hypothetical protein